MVGGEVFIPRIPSTGIVEIAKSVCSECEIEYIGIRPGEKLHETLISEAEAVHTLEQENRFVILPTHKWFERGKIDGKPYEGKSYSSDTNPQWLSVHDLGRML